jgi:predicted AAA+ superfamily ATPase
MKRKIYDDLLEWKNRERGHSALLIQGARRVGKSYIVDKFGKNEYKSYITIDFNKAGEDVKDLFLNDLDNMDTFFLKLSTYYGVQLFERESLIVLDEVQLFPRARSAVKYLVEDGRYDYIETGSLISIRKNVESILIPSEEDSINMYPMDFEEFLWASGNDNMMALIRSCFNNRTALGQALHRKVMDQFRLYMLIGGMPQAVSEYMDTHDFEAVDRVKRRILKLYRDDIRKHAGGNALRVEAIFDEIPSQLKKQNRHFKLAAVEAGLRFDTVKDDLFWLSDAMIVNNCYNSTEPNIGLTLNRDTTLLKCYMSDTGLLISHAFDERGIVTEEIYKKLLFDKLEVNLGMLTENMIAQMLTSAGHKLYFYANASRDDKTSRMELDVLLQKDKVTSRHNIIPIEVKSGKNYTLSSVRKAQIKYKEYLDTPIVIHTSDYLEKDDIIYLPIYMTPLI